ncbi:class I SAM-dependent methyltransferase [Natranaeroarchaeum aerophilus]|uniref:Methyltransferase domain-containing protein n=1 Tax=Natranaeroarchaeum aerophilus TaxID=2917711 RepID=A0AAE3FTC9_9EURY|nr:methyltransferase domain-containing protein [Natranaeroarchaeum aerophilus]MCL9815227.1 methyltransferase domain-containing protein [Natranaeroarchaeum aerophilus]
MTSDPPTTADPAGTSTSDAQAFYGRWARLYDALARYTPGIARVRTHAATALRLEPGDTVVEMGCGTGANLPYLRERVGPEGTVIGIDYTREMLDAANDLVGEYDNVHLIHGDATARPLAAVKDEEPVEQHEIDAVLATFVVGMLDDPAAAVDGWCDQLADGGHLVLVNAARSDRWYGAPLNALFRAVVVLSTPPTTKLRYETDPHGTLDRRIVRAHDALRDRASETTEATFAGGIVRLTGGQIRR